MEAKIPARVEAVKKIKYLVRSANICLFSTSIYQWPMENESLATQWVDDSGNIWFLINDDVHKKEFLANNGNIQLFYSNASKAQFLNVLGGASVAFSNEAMENLLPSASLQSGPITLVKVVPHEAYFWDTGSHDMALLLQPEGDEDTPVEQKLCA